jgi:hypothetical protein
MDADEQIRADTAIATRFTLFATSARARRPIVSSPWRVNHHVAVSVFQQPLEQQRDAEVDVRFLLATLARLVAGGLSRGVPPSSPPWPGSMTIVRSLRNFSARVTRDVDRPDASSNPRAHRSASSPPPPDIETETGLRRRAARSSLAVRSIVRRAADQTMKPPMNTDKHRWRTWF